jgi:putative ABC transport system ATP-binding protein
MTDTTTLVRLEGIYKDYALGKVSTPALQDVNLAIERGEFTTLTGPSGSGKTSLLNLIGCIDKPTNGTIRIDGRDVTSEPLHKLSGLRARTLGFIFQTFNLLPVLDAFENVEYPLLFSGLSKRQRQLTVSAWLDRVGLTSHAHHRPDQLSGGQRQRVAIARAMVTQPLLILADEPTASLDSRTADGILDLLADLNATTSATFLFATHDPRVMERAHRRVEIRDGRIELDRLVVRENRRYSHANAF